MLAACGHAPPKSPDRGPRGNEEFLVTTGSSSEPSFSSDGKTLLFISGERPTHKQNQVYELSLDTRIEKRITFQNGDTYWPRFSPHGKWILYSSSTDELKETPPLLGQATPKAEQKLPFPYNQPLEVYLHATEGFKISRLSHVKGFDGEATFSHDGHSIIWTRATATGLEVVSYRRANRTLNVVSQVKTSTSQMTESPDGKWKAWVEWAADHHSSKIFLKAKDQPAAEVGGRIVTVKTDLRFSPDSRWLMWSQKANDRFQIWTASVNAPCPARLNAGETRSVRDPVVSPDGKWLAFTLIDSAGSRIARIPFKPSPGACPATH